MGGWCKLMHGRPWLLLVNPHRWSIESFEMFPGVAPNHFTGNITRPCFQHHWIHIRNNMDPAPNIQIPVPRTLHQLRDFRLMFIFNSRNPGTRSSTIGSIVDDPYLLLQEHWTPFQYHWIHCRRSFHTPLGILDPVPVPLDPLSTILTCIAHFIKPYRDPVHL